MYFFFFHDFVLQNLDINKLFAYGTNSPIATKSFFFNTYVKYGLFQNFSYSIHIYKVNRY